MKNPEHTGRIFTGAACIVYAGIWYGNVFLCRLFSKDVPEKKESLSYNALAPPGSPLPPYKNHNSPEYFIHSHGNPNPGQSKVKKACKNP